MRLKTMIPLYPCGKPFAQEGLIMNSEKLGPFFFNHQRDYDGITASNLNPMGVFSFLQSNRKFTFTFTCTPQQW